MDILSRNFNCCVT